MYLADESDGRADRIREIKSRLIAPMNICGGSSTASSGGSSPWSDRLDSRSDPSMCFPGLWVIRISNCDRNKLHLDCRGDNRCVDLKYERFL